LNAPRPIFVAIFAFGLLLAGGARADDTISSAMSTVDKIMCPDQAFYKKMFQGVCWQRLFPVKLMGTTMRFGMDPKYAYEPAGAAQSFTCECGGNLKKGQLPTIGVVAGLWMPTHLHEAVRQPYCMPAMGGVRLPMPSLGLGTNYGGNVGATDETKDTEHGFYWAHDYIFPPLAIMSLLDQPRCNPDGFTDFDIFQMAEWFPFWFKPTLGQIISPEAALFANPVAMAAEPLDVVMNFLHPLPAASDKLFWVHGAQGGMYPISGYSAFNGSPIRTASQMTSRFMFLLARLPTTDGLGLVKRTMGDDALCEAQPAPLLTKSNYEMQTWGPVTESAGNAAAMVTASTSTDTVTEVDPTKLQDGRCTHNLGETTLKWGEWRVRPATGEDFSFIRWQWVDCCIGMF